MLRAAARLLPQVFAAAAGPIKSWDLVLDPQSEVGPFRVEHFDSSNLGRWEAAGYNTSQVNLS